VWMERWLQIADCSVWYHQITARSIWYICLVVAFTEGKHGKSA
jgi:hypothetical protein